MSLLEDDRPTNPTKHFIQLKNGALSYYDKELGENVPVPTPLRFIVLDTLATVKGWHGGQDTGIWANEVKKVGEQELNVRTKNGLIASGLWKDIKEQVVLDGGKFHSALYVAAQGENGMEIQCITLKGAALNAWIEFSKANNIKQNAVTLSDWKTEGKAVKYQVPVFTAEPMEESEKNEAIALATELKSYHDQYFSKPTSAPATHKDDVIEDVGDEPINLDDIPF
jgi:hypothetical protein